ncbi:abortive infection family protein [Neorhizobium sp. DAR64861/K0K2]|uniref:abortive infection family protein n=1 Tax=unclassified Neorhizobium TaxID=2629175 RepID=UPI003D2C948D
MVDEEELPRSPLERALMMEQLLTASATGSAADTSIYEYLRQEFMQSDELKNLLPSFVRTSRTLDTFWPFIKRTAASYAERREFISQQFMPLIEHLEGRNRHPGDNVTSDALVSFDADGVHAVWNKALARRQSDPEGAITIARTLLETVCKRVLDELQVTYTDKEDLPLLYRMAAKELNLAPDQHTEEPIKQILGGAMTLVNGIGTLRNRLSDAHGRGGALPVRPSPRHASLAVNTAGAVATFLVETLATKKG